MNHSAWRHTHTHTHPCHALLAELATAWSFVAAVGAVPQFTLPAQLATKQYT